jgi:GNAT superfamily N-acetyltransferase
LIKIGRVGPTAIQTSDIKAFIEVYKEAFGGPPYFEHYTDEEVLEEVWEPHITHGRVVLARDTETDEVIGFGCAIPLAKAPGDIQEFLASCWMQGELSEEFVPNRTWYMSEMGVRESYRKQGVAYQLVRDRLLSVSHAGGTHYVMRTAAEGSNSRHLYEKVGSVPLAHEQDVSATEQVTVMGSQSTKRSICMVEVATRLRRSSRSNRRARDNFLTVEGLWQ